MTPVGSVAHEVLYPGLDEGVRIDRIVVRGPELETTNDPTNWYVDSWTYGDAGSEFGWVEATVCASGNDDRISEYGLDVIVTDSSGRPYDWDDGDAYNNNERGCETIYIDDLHMPDNPRILVMPTGY